MTAIETDLEHAYAELRRERVGRIVPLVVVAREGRAA